MSEASLNVSSSILTCKGSWTKESVPELIKVWNKNKNVELKKCDLLDVSSMDTAGAMFLLSIFKKSPNIQIKNASPKIQKLIELCKTHDKPFPLPPKTPFLLSEWLVKFGQLISSSLVTLMSFFSFVGGVVQAFFRSLINPRKLRVKATLYHMEQSGLNAIPIIALTSLLIGVVIAYQGAVQLERFGANIFIVEMVGIAATRELAPLIAAIVVAGRSASSYTAQLGVMKITEEVDAMKTLGFTPWEFLILPRVIGLMVVMPLLVAFADSIAVLGGMIVANGQLGISFSEFLDRFQEVIALKHIYIGLIKAPIFGWIISLIGCFRGFQVDSSTESVGKYTTISVVNAIFWVIAFNALFSVFLTELDI